MPIGVEKTKYFIYRLFSCDNQCKTLKQFLWEVNSNVLISLFQVILTKEVNSNGNVNSKLILI